MLQNIGLPGLIIILAIFLLLFGAKRIPDIAESFGKGIKKFKDTQNDAKKEIDHKSDSDSKDA
ncbi:MAG: twin-arginine translocase TatA/TatE family subunit [Fibrobacterales bacterium]